MARIKVSVLWCLFCTISKLLAEEVRRDTPAIKDNIKKIDTGMISIHKQEDTRSLNKNSIPEHHIRHHRPHLKRTIFLGHHFVNSLARAASRQATGAVRNQPSISYDQHKSSKKSFVKQEFNIHGRSGNMHVKADLKEQFIKSETGPVDVFIKNNEHKPVKPKLHLIQDVTGIKKSLVISD